ncbi:MAG: hypothetical protein AAGA75_11495 [Cyanobacteria bacterium P01_E01_bin.6]
MNQSFLMGSILAGRRAIALATIQNLNGCHRMVGGILISSQAYFFTSERRFPSR